MRKLANIFLPAVLLLVCVSCDKKGYEEELLNDNNVSLRCNSSLLFNYEPSTCQLAFYAEDKEFRAFTDNMSDYFNVTLSALPRSAGETLTGSVEWTTSNNIQYLTNLAFKVEKMDAEGNIWLWNKEQKLFIIVRRL